MWNLSYWDSFFIPTFFLNSSRKKRSYKLFLKCWINILSYTLSQTVLFCHTLWLTTFQTLTFCMCHSLWHSLTDTVSNSNIQYVPQSVTLTDWHRFNLSHSKYATVCHTLWLTPFQTLTFHMCHSLSHSLTDNISNSHIVYVPQSVTLYIVPQSVTLYMRHSLLFMSILLSLIYSYALFSFSCH